MLDSIVDWLKEITIFMVICETILSFAPTAVYKRYIKPFVGLIMLLWITSFLFGTVETDWNQRIDEIFNDYEQSVSRYLKNAPIVEQDKEMNKEQAENTYMGKEKLKEDIIIVDKIVINPIKIGEME